jgi:hypothetical protein
MGVLIVGALIVYGVGVGIEYGRYNDIQEALTWPKKWVAKIQAWLKKQQGKASN